MENTNQKSFNRIYPWFAGLSLDLLFFIAIDTLFLAEIVGLTNSQILFSTSIALVVRLVLQPILLFIIKRIGNTASVRLGTFMLIISACLYTFGKSFFIIVLAKIIYSIAFVFRDMVDVILKNNLEIQNCSDSYAKIRSYATSVYAIVTMVISLVATIMFNLSPYLPMACCIFFTVFCFILSFFIKEEKQILATTQQVQSKEKSKIHFSYEISIIIGIFVYALFYAVLTSTQIDGKLFIQNKIIETKTLEATSLIIGIIQLISRIVRVISNVSFTKISKKLGSHMGNVLSSLLVISAILISFGSFIPNFIIKVTLMSLGFLITLFIRDPFRIFLQDYILSHIDKDKRQSAMATMEFLYNILKALFSFGFGILILHFDFVFEFFILSVLAIIELSICIYLSKIIKNSKIQKTPVEN